MNQSPADLEKNYLGVLKAVKESVSIPVSVKLSPFFTNFAYTAKQFDDCGAGGLGLSPSLLGSDPEAVSSDQRIPCPSPSDRHLRVVNLSCDWSKSRGDSKKRT